MEEGLGQENFVFRAAPDKLCKEISKTGLRSMKETLDFSFLSFYNF
jgi:hypothetical protein